MKIELIQGDDLRVFLTIRDRDGQLVDLSGAQSIQWSAARTFGAAIDLTKTLAAGSIVVTGLGGIYFDIAAAESQLLNGSYKQETQIVTSGGLTYTVGQGELIVKPQIIGA